MKTNSILAALFAATLAAVPAAQADVIFDNGDYVTDTGAYSDTDTNFFRFSSFALAPGASTITDIHWWGTYVPEGSPQPLDDFTILFYTDDSGIPDLFVAGYAVGDVGRTDTGNDFYGNDIYEYEVDIAPLALNPATVYWISIINNTTADADDNWLWMWSDSESGSNGAVYDIAEGEFITPREDLAFALTNDAIVPEPATMSLVGLGLAGLALRRKRR